jgi:hypothetical protein
MSAGEERSAKGLELGTSFVYTSLAPHISPSIERRGNETGQQHRQLGHVTVVIFLIIGKSLSTIFATFSVLSSAHFPTSLSLS